MSFDDLCEILKSKNYKLTAQRRALLITLYENKNTLMSAEDLLNRLKESGINMNLSTVYRNIDTLLNLDLLFKHLSDSTSLYRLNLDSSHSHQMICTECGKTESIDFCPISSFKNIIDEKDFSLKGHKLELFGHCKNCKKK